MLADAGVGTSLIARGVPVGACLEALVAEDPKLVRDVHEDFAGAGARLLLTNTFGANRFKLARRGLADRVAELNTRGAELARVGDVVVAGSIGPLGARLAPLGRVRPEQAFEAYAEQVEALAAGGVDLLVVETQSDLGEVEQAILAARSTGDLPVVVTFTFTPDDRTLLGATAALVAERLVALGADGIGMNCGQGPAQALRLFRAMRPHATTTPLVAKPNAGGPKQVGGRLVYPATPDYLAEHARALVAEGAAIVGGCCGTGPAHIRAIAEVLKAPAGASVAFPPTDSFEDHAGVPLETSGPTRLAERLAGGRFVVAVELSPPRASSPGGILAAAETLAEAGADVVHVADSPLARMRMSPWAIGRLIQDRVGVETTLHFPTRGRNLLRLQGDLLAVHAIGIRNVFVCMGDPVGVGDYPEATDAVDIVPSGLISLITQSFNHGRDLAGASIGEPTSFFVGCALNPAADDLERECRLLRRKIDAGASFALTQPVFSADRLRAFRTAYEARLGPLELPILAGVLPVLGPAHAEFLHNEVPGISIPEEIRNRIRRAGDRAEREGVLLAAELLAGLVEQAAGVYLMPQLGRFDVAAELVEAARRAAEHRQASRADAP